MTALVLGTSALVGAALESKFSFWHRIEKLGLLAKSQWMARIHETGSSPSTSGDSTPTPVEVVPLPPIPYLSDEIFEKTDNMLVFMFPSEGRYNEQSGAVKAVISRFIKGQKMHANLQKVKLLYTIVPPAKADMVIGNRIEVMCYKGQRKLRTSLDSSGDVSDETIGEWDDFFRTKSTPVDSELKDGFIQHVSGDEFESEILDASSPERPVLLQMYEKSCFLCFLMRPFMNQLARLLTGPDGPKLVPFIIKRLDIEENDFPESDCPIVRGTPTFVLFRGRDREPIRYEEFKPRDLVGRICLDYSIPRDIEKRMYDLVAKVGMRFQLFSGLIMWNTESEKILDLLSTDSGPSGHHATIPFDLKTAEAKDKEMFNKYVSELMSEDMLKIDELEENLKGLKKELVMAEMHAITMGQVLGEKVLAREDSVVPQVALATEAVKHEGSEGIDEEK